MQKVEIDKDKPLEPGDLIELHFKTIGGSWLRYAHIALIEYAMEGQKEFKIISSRLPDDHTMIIEVRINKTNPVLLTAALIAGLIIAVGVVGWLTLDKVYQILESPAGKIGVVSFGILAAVAAIAIVLSLLQKK